VPIVSPSSSGFNGGTVTGQTVFTPSNKDTVPVQIKPVTGATADATDQLEVYDDTGSVLFFVDAAGNAVLQPASNSVATNVELFGSDGGGHASSVSVGPGLILAASTGQTLTLKAAGTHTVVTVSDTAATPKLGFFAATPIAQPAAIAAPAGGATIDTQARAAIVSILNALGGAAGGYGLTA
jgi:hypothetical protein